MRLHKVRVKNFRKLKDCEVQFRDATFLIGPNNTGKSSLFEAIRYLHGAKNVTREDYSKKFDEEEGDYVYEHQIEITAEYRDLPDDADQWLGFRGRVHTVDDPFEGETDKAIKYKKTWSLDKSKPQIFLQEHTRSISDEYADCTLVSDLEGDEFGEEFLKDFFGTANYSKALTLAANKSKLLDLPGYWDIDSDSELSWVENPGGIPGNVLSKLPRIVPIPAESCTAELISPNGALMMILSDLFAQVRSNSDNYRQAQEFLNNLAEELDPADGETDFGKLMGELNNMTHQLFPESAVHVSAQLDQPDKNIKPQFTVEMESNVKTAVGYQGHGMIRATVFQLLRCVQDYANSQSDEPRSTIFCFEEPELFLHPSAANQMRDAIYELAGPGCQIIATTHSPYMVNLGSSKIVSLCKFYLRDDDFSDSDSLNLGDAYSNLVDDERQHLKMLLKVDDYISRMFFARKSVFVEGDTEEVVIRETLLRLPKDDRARVIGNMEFLRARGKPVLISISKYLNALGIEYHILHDRDTGTVGAEAVNAAILEAAGETGRTMLEECIEDVLGYDAPSRDKPFAAYRHIQENWGDDFESIPTPWREIFSALCQPYLAAP
jgi:predicted ATP-dependent endonuclease of OLD family